MKYMKLDISISQRTKNINALISVKSISRQASRIQLYLSSIPSRIKREGSERFDIYTSWNEDILVDTTFLCIPQVGTVNATGMVDVNRSFEISFANEIRCEEFLSKLIEALHFWDARCKRSIRVTEKMNVDFPVNLHYGETNIEIVGKQMLEFAKYIQP